MLFAAKKFNEAELLYPQSKWAPRAALMAVIFLTHKIIIMMQNMSLIDFKSLLLTKKMFHMLITCWEWFIIKKLSMKKKI